VDAPTSYGKTKWEIEQLVLAARGYVVRPGQVYGGESNGLFGELIKFAKKSPIFQPFYQLRTFK